MNDQMHQTRQESEMSERHQTTLEDEIGRLEDLLDRCRDSQGYGGFSWRDRKSLVSCINRIIDRKIEIAFDAYRHGDMK